MISSNAPTTFNLPPKTLDVKTQANLVPRIVYLYTKKKKKKNSDRC